MTRERGENLARILADRAQTHPERTLFCFYAGDGSLRESFGYGLFQRRANYVARCLLEAGVSPGRPILLVYPPGLDIAVAFFACANIGAIPVPAPPPSKHAGWERLAHIASHAGADHVLTTSELAVRVAVQRAGAGESAVPWVASQLTWIATDAMVGELDSADLRPSETLFVQYTSGSTSTPRGVAVTHVNVIHNAGLCVDHERPIGVSWLPHFHDMGLLGYFLFSLVKAGEAHCFSPLGFLRRPVLWLDLLSRVRATITTAPNAAFEYCLRTDKVPDAKLEGVDLGSLRAMVNCSEPVRAGTFDRFLQRFSRYGLRASAHGAGYGLAEHTLCVTTGGRKQTSQDSRGEDVVANPVRFVSCGTPADDVDLRIVDPDTMAPAAPGQVGEIWVDSPSKAAGYWGLAALSDERFRAKVAGERNGRGYLRTGDLGFLRDGELYVCGRLRDMLVLNGKNVFPADLEALLEEQFAEQLSGRVAAFGTQAPETGTEEIIILVEGGADVPDLRLLRGFVQNGCGVAIGAVARVARGTIVRTSSGKVARQLCREKWEAGKVELLDIVTAGDQLAGSSIEELIAELVSQANALGDSEATLDRLGLDSIAFVNLSLALEQLLLDEGLDSPKLIEQVADLSLLQALRVSDLREALSVFRSGPRGVMAVVGLLDGVASKVRQDERDRMRADAAMPLTRISAAGEAGRGALVTGATGFLGAYLVKSLLDLTDDPIIVLVRGRDAAHGVARVRRALVESDMSTADVEEALRSRIRVTIGDLTLPRFGLCAPDWETLSRSVDRVYHSGAEVDYVKSYDVLRSANVLATREVLDLCAQESRKSLHYISTTFIFGWSIKGSLLESDDNAEMESLDFGYAQSKWVAEQLVRRAQRGDLSATVYRPSLVTASATGRFVPRDITVRVLSYMIRHGLTVDVPNQVSFLPVDICARNVVALSRKPDGVPPVLHMTSDDYHTIADICEVITRLSGYSFAKTGLEDFVAHAHVHCRPDDGLYPLLSFLDHNTHRILRMGAKRYDSTGYRCARDGEPMAVAHPTLEETVDPIVAFLQRERLVPIPPRQTERQRETITAGVAE